MAQDILQGLPPELWAEMQAILRKRAMADLLTQQSAQPVQAPRVKGRFESAINPLAGLAQLGQGYMAGQADQQATAMTKGLGEKYKAGEKAAIDRYTGLMEGTPQPSELADPTGDVVPPVPRVGADPKRAIMEALSSHYPGVREFAKLDFTQRNKAPEKYDAKSHMIVRNADGTITVIPYGVPPGTALEEKGRNERYGTVSANTLATTSSNERISRNRLAQAERHWSQLSAYQKESLRMKGIDSALALAEFQDKTGTTPDLGVFASPQGQPRLGGQQPPPAGVTPPPPGQGLRIDPAEQARRDAFASRLRANEAQVAAGGPSAFPPTQSVIPDARVPNPAATPPRAAPSPGLSPADQRKANLKDVQDRTELVRTMSQAPTLFERARVILKGEAGAGGKSTTVPTGSGIGAIVDTVGGWFGASPSGAKEADKLESIQGMLIPMMPRTPGAVSDFETEQFIAAVGKIGNRNIPIERRLAAVDEAEMMISNKLMELRNNAVWSGTERRAGGAGKPPPGAVQRVN